MSQELTTDILRQNIINLIERTLEDKNSELYKTLMELITNVASSAIESDNENDINWDETDELFGDFVPPTQQP